MEPFWSTQWGSTRLDLDHGKSLGKSADPFLLPCMGDLNDTPTMPQKVRFLSQMTRSPHVITPGLLRLAAAAFAGAWLAAFCWLLAACCCLLLLAALLLLAGVPAAGLLPLLVY